MLPLRAVELRELMVITVDVHPLVDLGGGRRYVPFGGGTFEGRHGLVGTILDGGVDWQTVRTDGALEIDAHYTLRTEDGETIEVRSQGLRSAPAAVAARLTRGEAVPPDQYYFRTFIRLFSSAPALQWMNELLAVSTGERARDQVHIHVHQVL